MKPACVQVSQLAQHHQVQKSLGKQIVQALNHLLFVLNDVAPEPSTLDHKLADYVFFPLHYLFRQNKTLPSRATELALKCLHVVISGDWCRNGGPNLSKQLLILLSILAGGEPTRKIGQAADENVSEAALQCLTKVIDLSEDTSCLSGPHISEADVPFVGQVITVTLDALRKGISNRVRLSATCALQHLVFAIEDVSVLRKFLPGVVSQITKLLQQGTISSTPYKMVEGCLQTFTHLLQKSMISTKLLPDRIYRRGKAHGLVDEADTEDRAWTRATAAQIKIALANMVHLQHHPKSEVAEALFGLCRTVLQNCRKTLADAESLALETLLTICSREDIINVDEKASLLQDMLVQDNLLVDALKAKMHDLVLALPRVIQSNDTLSHDRLIHRMLVAHRVISRLDVETDFIDKEISSCLQNSVKVAIQAQRTANIEIFSVENNASSNVMHLMLEAMPSHSFAPISLVGSSQQEALISIGFFAENLRSSRTSKFLRQTLVEILHSASGIDQLACLWLCSKFLCDHSRLSNEIDQFFTYPDEINILHDEFLETVYSACLLALSNHNSQDDADWRIQGIAIEILTFRACQEKQEFRAELVDALYPIVERLGSNSSFLQEHAITSLNIISKACGYTSSSDLIIQNIDYLVNSIALKFNTFDISPQTPIILEMMIQLCGPALIPYLDDLIDSIFSTLASFHGYPQLVESLFAVLSIVVNEGRKVNKPAPEAPETYQSNRCEPPISILELAAFLKWRRQREGETEEPKSLKKSEGPMISKDDLIGQSINDEDLEEASPLTNTTTALEETLYPPTKTYTTIQSIVRTGQHYLTHDSPTLRRRLLELTRIGCAILSQNENEFLPLINDIWPVVMKRLYDSEPYVCIEACKTLSEIFHYAGKFVSSRVDNEWPEIRGLYQRVYQRLVGEKGGKSARGRFTSSFQTWEELVELCCNVINYVNIDAKLEDDLLDMLGPHMDTRTNVRDALERMNPDAVWLDMELRRQRKPDTAPLILPELKGYDFATLIV